MTTPLARTELHDWHVAHGGRMVDFAGWSMPVQYSSIVEEHLATRTAVGLFDISHMGRLQFFGPDAAAFLDGQLSRRVTDMKPGQVRYALVCKEQGGILDDVLVYRLAAEAGEEQASFQMVVNASNRAKIVDWLNRRLPDYAVRMHDATTETAMLAVQGPRAIGLLKPQIDCNLASMRYYTSATGKFDGIPCFVSRTGYTGEDGCEIICRSGDAPAIWEKLAEAADEVGGRPVGLGARDTLRLEAAMPLYGHELLESVNPIQAGLSFAVNLEGREFIGRAALEKFSNDTRQPVRVGLNLDGRRVPRQGCVVLQGDEPVGEVTSGTYSPTFERPIAMAYIRPSAQAAGTHLAILVRGTPHMAVVVPLPFYERGKQT
jgi:glycine cleavage system T protein (aminomethyltransferase)